MCFAGRGRKKPSSLRAVKKRSLSPTSFERSFWRGDAEEGYCGDIIWERWEGPTL